jgi:hypothetical protein
MISLCHPEDLGEGEMMLSFKKTRFTKAISRIWYPGFRPI